MLKLHMICNGIRITAIYITLGLLRRNLFFCPQDVKAAYKGMVRPVLEYVSYIPKLQDELEKAQHRAARFVTRNSVYGPWSMTGILGQLKMESLKKRRNVNRLICYTKV